MKKDIEVSIVIVSYDTRNLLRECLASVREATRGLAARVIVVDNASFDGSADMVREQFPDIELIQNAVNLGFARATNLGTSRAEGEFVLWLNSDAFITSEALTDLLAFAQSQPKVGICCPQLLFGNGKWQRSFGRIPSPKAAFLEIIGYGPCMRLLDQLVWQFGRQKGRPRAVEYGDGACLLIRRRMLDEIGLLDERFFFFAEDAEYCLRARRHGWGVYYVPASQVVHLRGGSSAQKAPLRTQQLKKDALHTLISSSYGESAWRTYVRLIRLNYFLRYSICKIMATLGLVPMNRCTNYETILSIYSSD